MKTKMYSEELVMILAKTAYAKGRIDEARDPDCKDINYDSFNDWWNKSKKNQKK